MPAPPQLRDWLPLPPEAEQLAAAGPLPPAAEQLAAAGSLPPAAEQLAAAGPAPVRTPSAPAVITTHMAPVFRFLKQTQIKQEETDCKWKKNSTNHGQSINPNDAFGDPFLEHFAKYVVFRSFRSRRYT